MKLFGLTDIGLTRKINEDYYYISKDGLPARSLYIVAHLPAPGD